METYTENGSIRRFLRLRCFMNERVQKRERYGHVLHVGCAIYSYNVSWVWKKIIFAFQNASYSIRAWVVFFIQFLSWWWCVGNKPISWADFQVLHCGASQWPQRLATGAHDMLQQAVRQWQPKSSTNGATTTLSRMNFSRHVGHATIFSWMLTVACCLVVGYG